ncbi:hypothetical protein GUJ93_ZPchr0004g39247 [Zizania palustris]|uniref:Uncharacterized protein n=1 Tax=Zizania palustris TaxID=103762 RepID=A0A8J5VZJ4_ZIZPA|nr:hypothetical protein GUJ93_ZPchr0004g39247 [Zizania palustris]
MLPPCLSAPAKLRLPSPVPEEKNRRCLGCRALLPRLAWRAVCRCTLHALRSPTVGCCCCRLCLLPHADGLPPRLVPGTARHPHRAPHPAAPLRP